MIEEYVIKRTTKDGKYRITVDLDFYSINPLDIGDFPLHVYDWNRNYTVKNKLKDGEYSYESARDLLEDLLRKYGDHDRIVDYLVSKGKEPSHKHFDVALSYNKKKHKWDLKYWEDEYVSCSGNAENARWVVISQYDCRKENIDLHEVLYNLTDKHISDLARECMTDNVKIVGYTIRYDGSVDFHDNYGCDSNGIAYVVKDECVGDGKWFSEDVWKSEMYGRMFLKSIIRDIESWSRGDVYGYVTEKCVSWKTHRECLSEERDNGDYIANEWETVSSCSGFYGDPEYAFDYAVDELGLSKEDFE